jgi:hypothetical protein
LREVLVSLYTQLDVLLLLINILDVDFPISFMG